MTASPEVLAELREQFAAQLFADRDSIRLQAVSQLGEHPEAAPLLQEFLEQRRTAADFPGGADGRACQLLVRDRPWPYSLFGGEPSPLEQALQREKFLEADRLTMQTLCATAGGGAAARGWLYFTDVNRIEAHQWQHLDRLWQVYSAGKFGISVQRKLWLAVGQNWEKFWLQIGWKRDGRFTRYPDGFTWSLEAPKGHLPLFNQIRGNNTLETVFRHPVWSSLGN
ncbi:MAG: GUN4 domain-containing protein [Pseudanabaenaceae cyanobacterium]